MADRIVVEIDGDASGAAREARRAADAIQRSSREMQRSAASAAGAWQDAQGRWRTENSRFITSAQKAALGLDTIGESSRRNGAALQAMVSRQRQSLGELGHAAKRAGQIIGTALAGATAHLVRAGADFEQEMARVKAVLDATDRDMVRLTETAKRLGAETKFSASESAAALYELASAGFSTDEAIATLPGTMSLAAASGIELSDAAEISSNVLRGFQLDAEDSAHVADVLAEAVNKSSVEMRDLQLATKYIGPIAKTSGQSLEEMTAALSIMGDAGIKGEQAGTTLRGALVRLTAPTKMVHQGLADIGLSAQDLTGPDGLKPLGEIIKTVERNTRDMDQASRNAALAHIFGTEALSGMVAVLDAGGPKYDRLVQALERSDGASKKAADTMNATVKGAFEEFTGAIETVEISLYQRFQEPLRKSLLAGAQTVAREGKEIERFFDRVMGTEEFKNADLGGQVGIIVREIKQEIDRANLPQKFGEQFSKAIPVVARAAGEAAGSAAKAFGQAFMAADPLGKAVMGGWLLHKAGIIAAFRAAGAAGGDGMMDGAAKSIRRSTKLRVALASIVRANPILFAAGAIGTLVAAVSGFGDASEDARYDADALADAIDRQRDAAERLADFDLEERQRRLNLARATDELKRAEQAVKDARGTGDAEAEAEATQQLEQAKINLGRAQTEVNRIDEDRAELWQGREKETNAVTDAVKNNVDVLKKERDEVREGIAAVRDDIRRRRALGMEKDQLTKYTDELNKKLKRERELTEQIADELRNMPKRIKLHVDFSEIQDAIDAGRDLEDILSRGTTNIRPLTPTPQRPSGRGGGRLRGGAFRRFRGGGMVPVAVSSGEAIRFPDGSWGQVPGAPVAADNVHTALPAGSEVFTAHGQSLLAAGASRAEALASQLPHFAKGGKVQPGTYTATAYGPPWGGINGSGVTRTGVNLTKAPKRYLIAVDPRLIPLGSRVKVKPNPFGHDGAFAAEDTGGAIKGHRIDFYDWRGRKAQNAWGRRQVKVSRVSPGAVSRVDSRVVLGDRFEGSARGAGFEAGLEGARRIRGDLLSEMIAGSIGQRDVTGETERPERSSSDGSSGGGSGRIGRMISRAREIANQKLPYVYGGGHGKLGQPSGGGFDCSGYVSAILGAGGLINRPMTTDGLKTFGSSGTGKLMSIGVRGSTGRNAHTMIALRPNQGAPFQFFESGSGTGPRKKGGWSGTFPIKRHGKGFRKGGIVNSRGDLQPDPDVVGWGLRTGGKVPTLASLISRVTGGGVTDAGGTTRAFDALSKRLADTMRVSWDSLLRLVQRSVTAAAAAREGGNAALARRFDAIANLARGQQGIRLARPIVAFQEAGDEFSRDETILGLKQRIAGITGTPGGITQQAALVQSLLATLAARKTSLERGLGRAEKLGNPEIIEQYEQALEDLEVQTLEAQASLADLTDAQREAAEETRAQMFRSMESRAGSLLALARMTETMSDDVPALVHSTQVAAAQVNEAIRLHGQGSAEADAAFVTMIQLQRDLNQAAQAQRFEGVEGVLSDGELELLRAQVATPTDTADDRRVLERMLAAAQQGAALARGTGDREREIQFLQSIQSLTGQIESLDQAARDQTQALTDLVKQQRDEARRRARLSEGLFSVFSGMSPLIGQRLVGAFAQGTSRVPRTGLALVHRDERITPDPDGAFGLSQRTTTTAAPVVHLTFADNSGQLVRLVRAEVDGRAAQVVSREIGRRSRTLTAAPGGR